MRIAIVTESFAPDVNGVAHSVVRTVEHLIRRGHQPMVVAPASVGPGEPAGGRQPCPVVRVPSIALPGYRGFRLGLPGPKLGEALAEHAPDVLHLASPFVLGGRAATLAGQRGLPMLAVYQTDVAAYARAYGLAWGEAAAWRRLRTIHNAAHRTLAPSTAAATDLVDHGIDRVWLWRRGVDTVRFDPARRHGLLRRALAPGGELLVGYVGRLAAEKRVELLAETCRLPGVRVVIVGDGPSRRDVQRALPGAVFLGVRQGDQLARLYASLDVFVHTGPHETFGQTIQEAQASGLPVVAPAAGGPTDLVVPDVTGVLVPPEDGSAIAAAVAALAADPRRRGEYGRAARSGVAGRSWSAVGDELIGHYRAVLAEAPRAAGAAGT
ncbi:glycosyltransferase family 1 protein [Plantactinospora sp. KBS50]|uniref:glycosyltransferase family 4 protein n=1 Tax=Plantactinospora sp. KBS50 TaxID=2024580 RepID=UPI000BAA99F2|nr:glycosyltransferase family 1 protein [Plantactinospora sp. KBS50]ASW53848.1 glycosyl transferase family 1 [Plantactinospora sp. KBS50]